MADIVWPVDLPQAPRLADLEFSFAETAIRTQMAAGPAKVRRRFSAGVEPFTIGLTLTGTQVNSLRTFFDDTTAGGSLPFEWTHPQTGVTPTDFRFTSEPMFRPRGPRTGTGSEKWLAIFGIEAVPVTGVAPIVDHPEDPWIDVLQQQYLDLVSDVAGEEEIDIAQEGVLQAAGGNPHGPPGSAGGGGIIAVGV